MAHQSMRGIWFGAGNFNYISGDDTVFEREPLEAVAAQGELMSYMHKGFGSVWIRSVKKNSWNAFGVKA